MGSLNGDDITVAQLEQVGLAYGTGEEVLHEVNLTLTAGSFRFLLGPEGAGKTSLLRLLRLSLTPTTGRLRLLGQDPDRLTRDGRARLRQRLGIVFQEPRLFDGLSTFDNVALKLKIAGVPDARLSAEVTPLLDWLGLGDVIERAPPALTPAQRQLAALARAAVGAPALLLADEPCTGLAPAETERALRLLLALQRRGSAVLLATREASLPAQYGLPTLLLDLGRLRPAAPAGLARAG